MLNFVKRRKRLFLLIVFALLLGAAYILRNPEVLRFGRKPSLVFPGFDSEKIGRIKISAGGEEEAVLVRKDGAWVVGSAEDLPADEAAVREALETAGGLRKEKAVSANKANHNKFLVGKRGTKVVFQGGGERFELVVGKAGSVFGTTYFRRGGEEAVYLAEQDLGLVFGPGEWRDLRIKIKNRQEGIRNIKVENANGVFKLDKKGKKWELVVPQGKKDIGQSKDTGQRNKC